MLLTTYVRPGSPSSKYALVWSKFSTPEVGLFTGYAPAMSILEKKTKGVEMWRRVKGYNLQSTIISAIVFTLPKN